MRPGRDDLTLRPGRDDDAAGLIALIGACWAEYPGCVMDLDGEVPELRALASHYAARGGALRVAERAASAEIVGVIAILPSDGEAARGPVWAISRLYVAASERGSGLAAHLLATAETHAAAAGALALELWTDTRFARAHRFYEKHLYRRVPESEGGLRALGDRSGTIEFRYAKPAGLEAPTTRTTS